MKKKFIKGLLASAMICSSLALGGCSSTDDQVIIYSNADEVMNGRYLWYFSKDNYDRNIKVIFKTSKEDFSDFDATNIPDQTDDSGNLTWINNHKILVIVIAMACFFGIIFTLIIYQRRSKNKN